MVEAGNGCGCGGVEGVEVGRWVVVVRVGCVVVRPHVRPQRAPKCQVPTMVPTVQPRDATFNGAKRKKVTR